MNFGNHILSFISAIRNFILTNISDTFKTITKEHFKSALGLKDNEVNSFVDANKSIITSCVGDSIIFAPKSTHTVKASNENESLVVGEILRIVNSVRECRTKK